MIVDGNALGSAGGAVFGALVSWAATTKTLAPKIAQLAEAVKGLGIRVEDNRDRVARLEKIHLKN